MQNNDRKLIGVLITQAERDYQKKILKGIFKEAFSRNMNVVVLAPYTRSGNDLAYQRGEMEIFSLARSECFDGLIFFPDNIDFINKEVISDIVRSKKCPVISVDKRAEGFTAISGMDHPAIKAIIEHLINVHGCRKIAFMTGFLGHPHAENRLNAFMDVMAENNLEVPKDYVYYGDFWYDKGADFVDRLIKSESGLPEAVACASSRMAYSVVEALKERGYSIPKDIIVTGYDEDCSKLRFISSSRKDPGKVGSSAVKALVEAMEGRAVNDDTEVMVDCGYELNLAYTCGCNTGFEAYMNIAERSIYPDEDLGFFSIFNNIDESLLDSKDFTDYVWKVSWHTRQLDDFEKFYLCMCENWDNPAKTLNENELPRSLTDTMKLVLSREKQPDGNYEDSIDLERSFPREKLLPDLWKDNPEPCGYIFTPMHYNDVCFGYSVISYGTRGETGPEIYSFWLKSVMAGIESQRRLNNFKYLYSLMEKNAVTDLMTGIYNRNGFNMFSGSILDEARRAGSQLLILMGDLNGLKYINDNFGHDSGDESIKIAALSMSTTSVNGAIREANFRIGGDEYIKIAYGHFDSESVNECLKKIRDFLSYYNKTAGKPFPVYISLGVCMRENCDITSIDEMLSVADKNMFADKKRVRKETGFDPKRC